jgi:hypothetical protein
MKTRKRNQRKKLCKWQGQVSLEFMFGMIGVVLLVVGMIQVFAWTGNDLMKRFNSHEALLVSPVGTSQPAAPLEQVRPMFYSVTKINATVNSNIFGEEAP